MNELGNQCEIAPELSVTVSPEVFLSRVAFLEKQLKDKEEELFALRETFAQKPKPKKLVPTEYTDFKSNGVRKPHAAESIRSYEDFKVIQNYFLSRGRTRDWCLWTVGVGFGLRISDLLSLKFKNILEPDLKTFRKRIVVYEIKTGKLQNCLITEAIVDAFARYFATLKKPIAPEDYVFPSRKTGGKMYEEYGWKILSDAGKACNLPFVVGSHTMRKSFANIAACVDKSCIDMNSVTKVQGLLNHSDQKTTMKYLGSYQEMFDRARIAVSDFILGKSEVNEIYAGNHHSIDDVMEALEKILKEK